MTTTSVLTTMDTRHRVPHPNARPRRIALVGLGHHGGRLAAALDPARFPHVGIVELPRIASMPQSDDWLTAVAGRSGELANAFDGVDNATPFVVLSTIAPVAPYGATRGMRERAAGLAERART